MAGAQSKGNGRFLLGYAVGVSIALALTLVVLAGSANFSSPILRLFSVFGEEGVAIYPADAFGQPGIKPKESTHSAKYERLYDDASFEPLADYPPNYPWRRFEHSVGLLDLAYCKQGDADCDDSSGIGISTGNCTASIISTDYLLTAFHCIEPGGYELQDAEFHLGFLKEGGAFRRFPVAVTPVEASKVLDYAVLKVNFGVELDGRKYSTEDPLTQVELAEFDRPNIAPVRLADYVPDKDERLFILHHPMKQPMVVTSHTCLSLTDTTAAASDAERPKARGWGKLRTTVRHLCDTLSGSSGAPVFTLDRNAVVAIHTDGTSSGEATRWLANRATRVDRIADYSRSTDTQIIWQLIEPKPFTGEEYAKLTRFVGELGEARIAYENKNYHKALALAFSAFPDFRSFNAVPSPAKAAEVFLSQAFNRDLKMLSVDIDSGHVLDVGISEDNKFVSLVTQTGAVATLELTTGDIVNLREIEIGGIAPADRDVYRIDDGGIVADGFLFPEVNLVLLAYSHGNAGLWNIDSGNHASDLIGHRDRINSALVSQDGQLVVSTSNDGSARVWNLQDGTEIASVLHGGRVTGAKFSRDGKSILTLSDDNTARITEISNGSVRSILTHDSAVTAALFAGDADRVLTASMDGAITLWNVANESRETALREKKKETDKSYPYATNAVFTENNRLITAMSNNSVWIWDIEAKVYTEISAHRGEIIDLQVMPEGDRFLTASTDGLVKVWSAESGQLIASVVESEGQVTSIAISADKQFLVSGFSSGNLEVARVSPEYRVLRVRPNAFIINDAEISPSGRYLAVADREEISVWDLNDNRGEGLVLPPNDGAKHTGEITSIAFSPLDDDVLLSGSADGTVRIWNPKTAFTTSSLQGNSEASKDTNVLVEVGVSMFDPVSGISNNVRTEIINIAFSKDGERIITASRDSKARVWRLNPLELQVTLKGHRGAVLSANFSNSGEYIVTASSDGASYLWDAASGEQIQSYLKAGARVNDADFSPDDRKVITSDNWGHAKIWDRRSGNLLLTLEGHDGPISRAQFVPPNGDAAITASHDGTLKVWDVSTGAEIQTLVGHSARVNDFAYSTVLNEFVSIADDGTAVIARTPVIGSDLFQRAYDRLRATGELHKSHP